MSIYIGKYDVTTIINLINNTVETRATIGHLIVKVPLSRITALTYHMVLKGDSDCFKITQDRQGVVYLHVGLDVKELTYDELLLVTNYTIVKHYTGLSLGKDEVSATKNPFLFLVTPEKGPRFYLTSADGRNPSVSAEIGRVNKLDNGLKKLIADHDWYYEYSSDPEVYNRGAEQKKDIILRLKQLNVSDPNMEYKRLATIR